MRVGALAVLVAVLSGCGTQVKRQSTVVHQSERWLAERPAPAAVAARADADGLLLRVKREGCLALVQRERAIEDHVTYIPRSGPTIAGFPIALAGGLLLLVPAEERGMPAGNLEALGILMVGSGTIVMAAQPSEWEERVRYTLADPPRESPAECRHVSDEVASVALVLPDGDRLPAEETATGLWRVHLPESVWQRFGRSFHAWVYVDGIVARGVRLWRP